MFYKDMREAPSKSADVVTDLESRAESIKKNILVPEVSASFRLHHELLWPTSRRCLHSAQDIFTLE